MSSQRRRVRNQSATATIVNFFLDQPLDVVSGALELAQTLVARRKANGDLDRMRQARQVQQAWDAAKTVQIPQQVSSVPMTDRIPPGYVMPPGGTIAVPIEQAAPSVAPPRQVAYKSTEATRQRAKRSDAGQPRKRVAGAVANPPVAVVPRQRRTRKPVDVPLPGTTAAAPELPPQDIVDDEFAVDALTELEG